MDERGIDDLVDLGSLSALSEIVSKSPCSFPMISTTACDLASSRARRSLSARSLSFSFSAEDLPLGPEGLAAKALRPPTSRARVQSIRRE
ncbi:hypothetical protein ABZ345_17530 [Lentzea sp. NPDC005914]|uniref:hypothetical protein n=1 Tax=Lentzea sp. NPDC005914 TaxID=3154572 RepID=UPI0033F7011E